MEGRGGDGLDLEPRRLQGGLRAMPLELVECCICHKAFVRTGGSGVACPRCQGEAEALYGAIRALLRDHGDLQLTPQEVGELLGIEERVVQALVKEGRLELQPLPDGSPRTAGVCPGCGAAVTGGGLCERCRSALREECRAHRRGFL